MWVKFRQWFVLTAWFKYVELSVKGFKLTPLEGDYYVGVGKKSHFVGVTVVSERGKVDRYA